jgi:hypothetical protein
MRRAMSRRKAAQMHFVVLVVTYDKPTEAVLEAALAPFGIAALGPHAKWDEWALGGRYTGLLIPHDLADTVTGGPHVSEMEMLRSQVGAIQRPGHTGPGVDALRKSNLKDYHGGRFPFAVLIEGQWHSDGVPSVEGMLRGMGLDDTADQQDFTEERAALRAWCSKFETLMDGVAPDLWLALIDCHSL